MQTSRRRRIADTFSRMETIAVEARCPGCGERLEKLVTDVDGIVAGCQSCGGLWLDGLACVRVLAATLTSPARKFIVAITEAAGKSPAGGAYRKPAAHGDRTCPLCKKPLRLHQIEEPPLTIDVCEHGSYFDRSELGTLVIDRDIRTVAHLPAIDRMRAEMAYEKLQNAIFSANTKHTFSIEW